ncbi:MAG: hypothetical protein IAE84_05550 [Saprospiraceae bacterium]|nr:hypothetical protein [Saprospiraceae bacterium]
MAALFIPDFSKTQPPQHPALRAAGVQLKSNSTRFWLRCIPGTGLCGMAKQSLLRQNQYGRRYQKAQAAPYGADRSSVVQIVFVEFVTKTFPLSRDDSGGVVLFNTLSFSSPRSFTGLFGKTMRQR